MQRINLHYITTDGTYADVENNYIRKLTPEQMKQLYDLYPEEFGTKYKVYLRKQRGVPNYKLSREKKFVSIKELINKVKYPVIIGTSVVLLGFGAVNTINNQEQKPMVVETVAVQNHNYVTAVPVVDKVVDENIISPEMEYQLEMSQLVKQYCDIYEVDYDIVYNKLCELTDNFTSEDFMNQGYIPGVTCKKQEVYTDNVEFSILTAVRAISQLPNKFGLRYDEIHIDVPFESDESYEMLIAKYADVFGISEYRNLAYGICFAETGGNSRLLVEDNNYGGLKSSTGPGFDKQANKHLGAIEFIATLKYVYIDNGLTTPIEIQPVYAPSFENDGEQWVSNVEWNTMKAESVYQNLDEHYVVCK